MKYPTGLLIHKVLLRLWIVKYLSTHKQFHLFVELISPEDYPHELLLLLEVCNTSSWSSPKWMTQNKNKNPRPVLLSLEAKVSPCPWHPLTASSLHVAPLPVGEPASPLETAHRTVYQVNAPYYHLLNTTIIIFGHFVLISASIRASEVNEIEFLMYQNLLPRSRTPPRHIWSPLCMGLVFIHHSTKRSQRLSRNPL